MQKHDSSIMKTCDHRTGIQSVPEIIHEAFMGNTISSNPLIVPRQLAHSFFGKQFSEYAVPHPNLTETQFTSSTP
jgi:hypothetical protein